VAHGEEEGVDACVEGIGGHFVNEAFGFDTTFVVVAEEDFDDGVKLEVHEREILIYISWREMH
jgi:hypothetical protein